MRGAESGILLLLEPHKRNLTCNHSTWDASPNRVGKRVSEEE